MNTQSVVKRVLYTALLALGAPVLSAQPGPAATEPSAPLEVPDAQSRSWALRGMRDALIRAGDFTAALEPAQGVVDTYDAEDPGLAVALVALAYVQIALDELDAAESNLLRAIDLIEREEGSASLDLLDPYRLLASVQVAAGRPEEAIVVLQQAVDVSRRILGLFNLEQLDLLDRMTAVQLEVGNTMAAQELQEQKLDTVIRHFGDDTAAVIPYRYQLADYYNRSRLRQRARSQFASILETQRTSLGPADPALLQPLRELMQIDLLTGEDSGARAELAGLLASQDLVLEPDDRALSLLALGDWDMATSSIASGLGYYGQAYATLRSAPDEVADEYFAEPVMIDFVPPLSPVDRGQRRLGYSWGRIELRFSVSAEGRVSDIEVVAAEPSGLMDAAYTERLGRTQFRPRFVDGLPVATQGVRLTHHFRHYVDEETDE
jgi:TonB family protein